MSGLLGSVSPKEVEGFLDALSDNCIGAMPWLFECWAMAGHQLPPAGKWQTWVIMGGRGAGKTRAGAEWVRARVEGATPRDAGQCRRVALIGETLDQAREIMVFGDSGIIACSPPDRKPHWTTVRRGLVRRAGEVEEGRRSLGHAAVRFAARPESPAGGDNNAA
jgi:phage terminase large subunit-like protein